MSDFCNSVGVPEKLKSDRAPELIGKTSAFLVNAKNRGINFTFAEPERKNQIWKVDLEMRELGKQTHHKMKTKNVAKQLWDFNIQHSAKIMQFLPHDTLQG